MKIKLVKYAVKDTDPNDGWVKWRCPHCNVWDYALQDSPDRAVKTRIGVYKCSGCGDNFAVPYENPGS